MIEIGKIITVESFSGREFVTVLLISDEIPKLLHGSRVKIEQYEFKLIGWRFWGCKQKIDFMLDGNVSPTLVNSIIFLENNF